MPSDAEDSQHAFCAARGIECVPASGDGKLGFALSTRGRIPINGLRHPVTCDTNGWYLWCGEEFSQASDFFVPWHAKHVFEEFPEITKLLGLPPGYRFLLAGDYLDIWYDQALLNVWPWLNSAAP
jgi:hypothetical protein